MLRQTVSAAISRFVPRNSAAFTSIVTSLTRTQSFSSASTKENDRPDIFLPRITEKRFNEGGPGGRSSNAGIKVAIFGATGFLGKHLCYNLGHNGAYAYIGNRGDEVDHREIKTMFDLGHTRFVYYSPRDIDSMKEVISDADIVINLISKTHDTGQPVQKSEFPFVGWRTNYSIEDVNVGIAKSIAELCVEMQVDNLIHVSAAGVSEDHPSNGPERSTVASSSFVKYIHGRQLFVRLSFSDRRTNYFITSQTWRKYTASSLSLVTGAN